MTLGIGPADWPQPAVEGGSNLRALGRMLMGAPPSPGLDWEAVWVLARGYGLSPLLYFRLCERGNSAGEEEKARIPEDVVEVLRLDYHAMVARRMAAEQQIVAPRCTG